MKFKNFLVIVCLLSLLACDDNTELMNGKSSSNIVLEAGGSENLTGPDRHWCCEIEDCQLPAIDCMPDVVVQGNQSYINALDNYIATNNVDNFFAVNGDYLNLFPNFGGEALNDLRDSITTLRKVIQPDSNITYRLIMLSDTTSPPDYSSFYSNISSTYILDEECNDCQ